jgi:hypothetical protein
MDRREFITFIAGAAAWPQAARAQQSAKIHRVGFLWDGPTVFPDALEAFRGGLRDLGYVEGRNLVIEYRWAEGKPARMRELAEELVRPGSAADAARARRRGDRMTPVARMQRSGMRERHRGAAQLAPDYAVARRRATAASGLQSTA